MLGHTPLDNGMQVDEVQKSGKSKVPAVRHVSSVSEAVDVLDDTFNGLELEKKFAAGQTAFHHSLNKLAKATEKDIPVVDPSRALKVIPIPQESILRLSAEHLLRSGNLEAAKKICPSLSVEQIAPYEQLKSMIECLRARNVDPILDWIATEPVGLDHGVAFELTYNLRKLHYGNLIKGRLSEKALEYAREHFLPYMSERREDMHKLLGALAFLPSIDDPAYKALLGSTVLMKTEEQLAKAFCRSRGLPTEAHLLTLVRASAFALPCLAKADALTNSLSASQSLSQSNTPLNGSSTNLATSSSSASPGKLSFEIPLPKDFSFHSLFCCPVSKELSTPLNPPQLLPCGHVLSKEIITELAKGRSSYRGSASTDAIHPFKCPYCPEKVFASQVKTISFD